MAIRKKIIAGTLAALALAATTAGAFAAPAFATTHLNVRSGPGTHFRVVDVLSRGERVDIQYCRGSWCFVEKRGPDGWASARYLDRRYRDYDDDYYDDDYFDRHDRYDDYPRYDYPRYPRFHFPRRHRDDFDARFCVNGPNGYFCFGT